MSLKIVEVGLRDGLQNEEQVLPTEKKIQLLQYLLDAGMKNIEVTSFVHPKWIPQLADADQLVKLLPVNEQYSFRALVPNVNGYKRVISPPLTEIAVFISTSETHNLRNLNRTISQTLEHIQDVVMLAKQDQIPVRGYLSCVYGCPYEGSVAEAKVIELCEQLLALGIYEISLGDTIGIATPSQVKPLLSQLNQRFPGKLASHFHDTRGMALVNTYVALEAGITTFDSSLGGLGGCPYAPGASGNLATEELVFMLESMGIDTGINLDGLCAAAWWVEQELGKTLSSKVLRNYVATREEVD
jgi:hydroxymethylglutaryl-CoA lyase